jgi:alpha-tubulin suppressor-like RCC1 family protein
MALLGGALLAMGVLPIVVSAPAMAYETTGFTAVSITAGYNHSLAVGSDGTVWAWGSNSSGQLGDGTTSDRSTAVQVKGLTDVKSLAAGADWSMALKNDGTVWTWGGNDFGQLGDGTHTDRHTPVQVSGLTGVSKVAAGIRHALALKDGAVYAWGFNDSGQLGDDTTTNRSLPVAVVGAYHHSPQLTGVTDLAGGANHSYARMGDGGVMSWGNNGDYQLGYWSQPEYVKTPYPRSIPNLGGMANVESGSYHGLALGNGTGVLAWGLNSFGQVGDGSTTTRDHPVESSGLTGVAKVAGGDNHSLALMLDGTMRSWGINSRGELGDGTTDDRHSPSTSAG